MSSKLQQEFFERSTKRVAKNLIGKFLVSRIGSTETRGIVVETEAYLPLNDSACHAAKSRTARTEVMFGRAGVAYVYPIHAKVCFNVVTEVEGQGCAVLIRALEPVDGIKEMKNRRGLEDIRRLTTGPACLCQAMGIERPFNGVDLANSDELFFQEPDEDSKVGAIKSSERIGVTSAKDLKLRFYVASNQYVSGPKRLRV